MVCHGRRWVIRNGALQPCEECGGQGELNCCEGMQAQPEPDGEAAERAEDGPEQEMSHDE